MQTQTHPNGQAPQSPEGVWSMGPRLYAAWQQLWDRLGPEFQDGTVLAAEVAAEQGLRTSTVLTAIHRAARSGMLESELRQVATQVDRAGRTMNATRARKFIRIAR